MNAGHNETTGGGTQTAALCVSGDGPGGKIANTEEYNGTSWTEVTDVPTTRTVAGFFGIQTAAVVAGGNASAKTEHYDGTNWTEGGNLLEVNQECDGMWGTQTAGMFAGGHPTGPPSPVSTQSSTYDGTAWATNPTLSTGRDSNQGTGTQAAGITINGKAPPTPLNDATTTTEYFTDVTSAAEAADIAFD